MATIFSILLSLITLILIRFVHKVICIPFYVTFVMRTQGITGPEYKLIYGSTKEGMMIKEKFASSPMELSSHDIFSRVQPHLYSWMKQYGKNFLIWIGPQPQLVITEPELAKEILNNKEGMYPKIKMNGMARKLLGDGLVVTEGEKWARLRKLANHAFYAESLKDMVPAMVSSAETMLANWKQYEDKEIEVYKEFMMMSSEVISRTAFGSSYLEGKNIFEMLNKLGALVVRSGERVRFYGMEKIFRTAEDIESDKVEQSLRDSIVSIVKKREDRLKSGEADNFGSDFLGLLLKAHYDPDQKSQLSVENIIDECKVFYIAGHETSSSLLSWAFLLLATHSDWQHKAREEVIELFGQEYPKSEGLAKLKIVSMIIHETLRLYSPVTNLMRRTKGEVRLGKYELPANMELNITPLALHTDQEIWGKDAHLFKPERFSEGVAMATKNNPMAFLPFGFGPRTCVGLNFAINEVKIAISMVLQRYKFTLSPNYVHVPFPIITVRPLHGVQIMLQSL